MLIDYTRRLRLLAVSAAFGCLAHPALSAPVSNATVAIPNPHGAAQVVVVGTSTITVQPGTTVATVVAQLAAKDGSIQTYGVQDAGNQPKTGGAIASGDRLIVTAADGVSLRTYELALYDVGAKARDGVYWNQDTYNAIDATVNANTPVFRNVDYSILDPKYAGLVRQVTDGIGQTVSRTVWYYGDAIKAAIADANGDGGGRVVVPAAGSLNSDGAYYTGAINLLSNVNLYVASGATVKFVRNPTNDYYPLVLTSYQGSDFYNYSPPVYALGQTNLAITGGGTFDAQYNVGSWRLPPGVPGAKSGSNNVLNDLDYRHVPIEQRIFSADGSMPSTIPVIVNGVVQQVAPPTGAVAYKTTFLPQYIEFNHSSNILIEGPTFINTIFWQVHPLNSRNILIRGTTVYDIAHHTDDGIDPESCNFVVLENNSVTALDDGTAIKSGRNLDGRYRDPSENIIIRNTTFNNPNGGSAGISAGSENSGSVINVFTENNVYNGDGIAYVLKIKMNGYRGGVVHDIYARNSTVNQTIRGIVNFDTNYSEGAPFQNGDIFNPTMYNIYLDNVNTTSTVRTTYPAYVISSDVSRSPIENVFYRNSVFHTTVTFPSAFSNTRNRFFKNMIVDHVTFINPNSGAQTLYDNTATQPQLTGPVSAMVGMATVPLAETKAAGPITINRIAGNAMAISGKVDLASDPGFAANGAVRVYLDRSTTPIPVTVNPDGTFVSGIFTLDDTQYWYVDPPEELDLTPLPYDALDVAPFWYRTRHYVSVNLSGSGLDLNTYVYLVSDRVLGDADGDEAVTCNDLTASRPAVGRKAGQPGYLPSADMDSNGVIDIRDIAAISRLLPVGGHC
jgi:polygalacturonase